MHVFNELLRLFLFISKLENCYNRNTSFTPTCCPHIRALEIAREVPTVLLRYTPLPANACYFNKFPPSLSAVLLSWKFTYRLMRAWETSKSCYILHAREYMLVSRQSVHSFQDSKGVLQLKPSLELRNQKIISIQKGCFLFSTTLLGA